MHAARAIKANREKRQKAETRRSSVVSQAGQISIPRSPAVSIITTPKKAEPHPQPENEQGKCADSNNLNFSFIGFLIATFGAVPLIVGTFVEVPVLWEIGLGVTLVGLFIGVVFWCTELCAEAKQFSYKKNQLSTRGRIEDSTLDKHFPLENGSEVRPSPFPGDRVSPIPPTMTQSFNSNPQINLQEIQRSLQQFSDQARPNEITPAVTYNSAITNPGYTTFPQHPLQQPKLLLRGTRRNDNRVVSLVQPDPGLEDNDDSNSDSDTVIEAAPNQPKIILVQTCLEKEQNESQFSQRPSFENKLQSGVILSVAHHKSKLNLDLTNPYAFHHIENEFIPSSQHGTICMPVMPQEIEKLQRCEECGRFLLTERDKLAGVRLVGVSNRGSSLPATAYNSPLPVAKVMVGPGGTAPATRKVYFKDSHSERFIFNSLQPSSTNSSLNDVKSAELSDKNEVIQVKNPIKLLSVNNNPSKESAVQVEPTLNSSEILDSSRWTGKGSADTLDEVEDSSKTELSEEYKDIYEINGFSNSEKYSKIGFEGDSDEEFSSSFGTRP